MSLKLGSYRLRMSPEEEEQVFRRVLSAREAGCLKSDLVSRFGAYTVERAIRWAREKQKAS